MMEETGVVTNTNTNSTNVNKNKFIVGGLVIGILILIGSMFLFGRKQEPAPGPTTTLPSGIVLPTIDQAFEAARTKVEINLTSSGFVPKVMTVKKGTRVSWLNKTTIDGTVSSNDHPTHQLYQALNLGPFPPDFSVQLVFEETGTYGYHNHLKPEQTGTIIVQ